MAQARRNIASDLSAGVVVALVAIPQSMAFAAIAGLPPVMGLYAATVTGLVCAALSSTPQLIVGPAVTISSMIFGVLVAVAPDSPKQWPALAGVLALLAGLMIVVAGVLRIGQFVRFVSRSVLVGLTAGAALLIFVSQLAPLLGVDPPESRLLIGRFVQTLLAIGGIQPVALALSAGTILVMVGGSLLGKRFPTPFLAIVLGGVAVWALQGAGPTYAVPTIGRLPEELRLISWYRGPLATDLFVGAAAIALVSILQTLAIAKALSARSHQTLDAKREVLALGVGNMAAGVLGGFPGAASFSRTALNDAAGARTRLSGIVAAVALAMIVLLAAPLARFISLPAIAGLLMVTAWTLVDWPELFDILRRGGKDCAVLVTTVMCVWVIPIHWAVLIGLALSIAVFLRRVSELNVVEMVGVQGGHFAEHAVDDQTGTTRIVMLQVEGPLFFAHADELALTLRRVLDRSPCVVILRMRRTQQIDFSVISALNHEAEPFCNRGGAIIICGLTPTMHRALVGSQFGQTIGPKNLMETTDAVFGSAHKAIELARRIAADDPPDDRRLLRRASLGNGEPEGGVKEDVAILRP